MSLTDPQRLALLWLAGEDEHLPDWYDTAHLSTLKALERKGLVCWYTWGNDELGPRPYWVKPIDNYLDHYGPVLTALGEETAEREAAA